MWGRLARASLKQGGSSFTTGERRDGDACVWCAGSQRPGLLLPLALCRPKVGKGKADSLADVQRFFMRLRPNKEGVRSRLCVIGKKRLPSARRHEVGTAGQAPAEPDGVPCNPLDCNLFAQGSACPAPVKLPSLCSDFSAS